MTSYPALSTVDAVLAVADRFFEIADLLHRRLNGGPIATGLQPSTRLYGLLVEEYGLRARAAILRNDAAAHVVENIVIEQSSLMELLTQAGHAIARMDELARLRSLVAGVSTLCVGISPGKGRVVEFLANELEADLHGFRTI